MNSSAIRDHAVKASLRLVGVLQDPHQLAGCFQPAGQPRPALVEIKRWEKAGVPSKLVEEMTGCATPFRTERFAIAGARESLTIDTRAACEKPLGSVPQKRFGDFHFLSLNSWKHFRGDHAVTTFILPLAPRQTLVRTRWLVHKDAMEGIDYDLDRLG
ncbi:hypothetical protein [Chelativorans xinjiangense]|uniref:hypothetical protein n=1 Tax=Chelativorans xinjiangense TaxID=2681485 RepID=UPI001358C7AA|nr:hypothetical protein [Chelativorans xinjiangense]